MWLRSYTHAFSPAGTLNPDHKDFPWFDWPVFFARASLSGRDMPSAMIKSTSRTLVWIPASRDSHDSHVAAKAVQAVKIPNTHACISKRYGRLGTLSELTAPPPACQFVSHDLLNSPS